MAKHMHSINLVPGRDDTLLIQFLNWALSIGRLLVILVETLALGTFLYRFTLDWQIVDYKDKIKAQRSIVESFKSQEEDFRDLQTRLAIIKQLDNASSNSPKILSDIIDMGKGYITFKSINVSTKTIRIEAKSSFIEPLMAFVNSLKKHPDIATVSIDRVENKTSSIEIIVGISAELKENDSALGFSDDSQTGDPFSEKKEINKRAESSL
jgi:hypothetical protein